jgi:hypothetical protein
MPPTLNDELAVVGVDITSVSSSSSGGGGGMYPSSSSSGGGGGGDVSTRLITKLFELNQTTVTKRILASITETNSYESDEVPN